MAAVALLWKKFVWNDWPRRLSVLFTGLLLNQYISWFSREADFWWPQTVRVVTYSLLITLLLDLFPWKRSLTRMALQLAGVLVYNAAALGYRPTGGTFHNGMDPWGVFYQNAMQLHPFLWFSLGAWCVYNVAVWWVRARSRIVLLMVLSAIVFAVRDSFSPLTLWKETVIVILCCLSLLIVQHYAEFTRQNPSSYTALVKHPLSIVLPAFILLGMILIPALFVSNVAPTVKDPYSFYLQWKGKENASLISALQMLEGLSAEQTSSGYGRNESNLGGGFQFDYSPVMEVETTHPSYWRGETRSRYTGRGWAEGEMDTMGTLELNEALDIDPRFPSNKVKKTEVRQTVKMLREESYPVLFGAFSISKLESIDDQAGFRELLRWAPKPSELRWLGKDKTAYPKTYTIVSEVPVLVEEGLRKATVEMPSRFLLQDYLQLPKDLPARVRQLAWDITASASTPYEKAKAIEQYLRNEYLYTNKPDDSKGQSEDFVDRFLFEVREGYCDYYSTAMVVLTRAAGIPSRWVKGYASGYENTGLPLGGSQNADGSAVSDGGGTYTVRNSDAHSWVEVYFNGWGWIPFEPTSGFVLPSAAPSEKVPELPNVPEVDGSTSPEPAVESPPSDLTAKNLSSGIIGIIRIIGAITGLIAAILLWFFRKRIKELFWLIVFPRRTVTENWNHRVIREFNCLLRLYTRKGFTSYEHETARETIERWKEQGLYPAEDLDMLLMLFEKAKYSPLGVTAEEFTRTAELIEKLRKAV